MAANNRETMFVSSTPDLIESVEELGLGCQKLYDQLDLSVSSLNRKITHLQGSNKLLAGKLNNLIGRIYSRVLAAKSPTGGKWDKGDEPKAENTLFYKLMEKLNTPESKAVNAFWRQSKDVMDHALQKKISTSHARTTLRHEVIRDAEKRAEEGDDVNEGGKNMVVALGQLIRDDTNDFITDETRKELLDMHALAIDVTIGAESNDEKLNHIIESIQPLYNSGSNLEKLNTLFKRNASAQDAVQATMEKLAIANSENLQNDKDPEMRISRLLEKIEKLTNELDAVQKSLPAMDTVIKAHFAEIPNLIPSITAILKEIRMLCGNLVKSEINEVTGWEIGIAQRQWPIIKNHLPVDNPLNKIDAILIEESLTFLAEREDFLAAYNSARQARSKVAALTEEIATLRMAKDDMEKELHVPKESAFKSDKFEAAVRDANRNLHLVQKELREALEQTARNAKTTIVPNESISKEIWTTIWNNFCEVIIDTANKGLATIESEHANLHKRIETQLNTVQ
jgi:hypothetical protein